MNENIVTEDQLFVVLAEAVAIVRQITAQHYFMIAYREARLEKQRGKPEAFWTLRYMPEAREALANK